MEELFRMVPEHALTAMGIAVAVLLILYVLFSRLIKLVLIAALVGIAVWGYFHFLKPEQRPTNFREAVEQIRSGVDGLAEKANKAYEGGREFFKAGKEGAEKGKELLDKGKAVVEKGIDRGKETVQRGKEAAGELGKRLGGEK